MSLFLIVAMITSVSTQQSLQAYIWTRQSLSSSSSAYSFSSSFLSQPKLGRRNKTRRTPKHISEKETTPNQQRTRPVVTPQDFAGLQLLQSPNDPLYAWGTWDEAPIVIESHKVLLFTIPKNGCTVWKQLARRMYGYQRWQAHDEYVPHHPASNGLNYLYHYPPADAERMLTDPSWTRAIFLRNPKERLLSAYLDKAVKENGKYIRAHCCHDPNGNMSLHMLLQCHVSNEKLARQRNEKNNNNEEPLISFVDFLTKLVPQCSDPHWRPQAQRVPEKYWPYMNFVGHMDRIEQDARALLERVGAWQAYGATGWGEGDSDADKKGNNDGAIFAGATTVAHATNAHQQVSAYYTSSALIRLAEQLHSQDYELFSKLKTASQQS